MNLKFHISKIKCAQCWTNIYFGDASFEQRLVGSHPECVRAIDRLRLQGVLPLGELVGVGGSEDDAVALAIVENDHLVLIVLDAGAHHVECFVGLRGLAGRGRLLVVQVEQAQLAGRVESEVETSPRQQDAVLEILARRQLLDNAFDNEPNNRRRQRCLFAVFRFGGSRGTFLVAQIVQVVDELDELRSFQFASGEERRR